MRSFRIQKWHGVVPFVTLMSLAYLLYMQAFSGVWLMDDLPVLVNNPDIRSLSNFLEDYYPGRPLRELTYLVDYSFFGLEPAGYYIQNIFWHGLCSWLFFLLARQLKAPLPVAWFSALLFLFHPLHVEVIANTSHRKDSLALAFCLLAFLSYLRFRAEGMVKSRWLLLAALSLWGIALLAKQNALVLPVVIAAYELYRLPSRYQKPAFSAALAVSFLGLAGALLYLTNSQSFLNDAGAALLKLGSFDRANVEIYYLTVLKAWAFMAGKLFFPVGLSMEYTFTLPERWVDIWVVSGIAAVLILILWFVRVRNRNLLVFLSLTWLVAFWMPTSNLFGPLSYFAADRYWYAPSVGAFLLVSFCSWRLLRGNIRIYMVMSLVVLSLLGWQNWQQQKLWNDEEKFYEHMIQVNPLALEGLVGMGYTYLRRGEYDKAADSFKKAFLRSPQDERIPLNLGFISYMKGDYETAMNYAKRTLEIKPDQEEAYNNLGSVYDALGQYERAIEALEKAININQHFEKAYVNLALVYENMGDFTTAERMYLRALKELPEYGLAHFNLGNLLYRSGRKDEALKTYAKAAKFLPEDVDVLHNYAVVAHELDLQDVLSGVISRMRLLDRKRADALQKEFSGQR